MKSPELNPTSSSFVNEAFYAAAYPKTKAVLKWKIPKMEAHKYRVIWVPVNSRKYKGNLKAANSLRLNLHLAFAPSGHEIVAGGNYLLE